VPLLVLATLLAYAGAVNTAFVFDDTYWITRNAQIGDAAGYLGSSPDRALVSLTVLLNYRLGGTNPLGYHLFNVGVHLAAGLTLFCLVRRLLALPRWGGRFAGRADGMAFAAALLWLVHPLNTQAVTYVIQRAESMMGLFFLLTFYCWVRAAGGGGRGWFVLAAASYLAACLCKEVAVTLFPLLVLFDRVFLAAGWREVAGRWPGFAAVGAVWGLKLYRSFAGALGGGTAVGIGFGLATSPSRYALTQTEVILHYLRLAVWPTGQCGDYLDWPVANSLADVWPSALALAAVLVAAAVALVTRPAVGFLATWFFVILSPTSSVMPISDVAFEHRMYLPLAAVVVGGVLLADTLLRRLAQPAPRVVGRAALASAAVLLGWLTHQRNAVYRTEAAFWQDAHAKRPGNIRAKVTVAAFRMNEGRLAEAAELLDAPSDADARHFEYRQKKGGWYFAAGDYPAAVAWFRQMLTDPWPLTVRFIGAQTARAMLANGDASAAVEVARKLVADSPSSADHRFLLAVAELAAGFEREAAGSWEAAVRLDPRVLQWNVAAARATLFAPPAAPKARPGLLELAYWYAKTTCRADATHPDWFDTLAMAASRTGRFPEAVAAAKQGIEAADTADDTVWKAALQDRLKRYAAGQVYGPSE
jgi:tetratricopeptide (TPR) repeat protein